MRYTTKIQSSLASLPLASTNLLVDADLSDDKSIATFLVDLRTQCGPNTTIVMPAFSGATTLVEDGDVEAATPFHNDLQIDAEVGPVAEAFRHQPGALRSGHPANAFTAVGSRAHAVLSTNRDNNPLGPLKKLNVMNGHVLLLSESIERCTALHLAEHQVFENHPFRGSAKRINLGGYEERVVVEHLARCTTGYAGLADTLNRASSGLIAQPQPGIRLWALRDMVRAATNAMREAPEALLCADAACRSCEHRRAAIARL